MDNKRVVKIALLQRMQELGLGLSITTEDGPVRVWAVNNLAEMVYQDHAPALVVDSDEKAFIVGINRIHIWGDYSGISWREGNG